MGIEHIDRWLVGQTVTCVICGKTVPRRNSHHTQTCGSDSCRWKFKAQREYERDPALFIKRRREATTRRTTRRRGQSAERHPWLVGAPPHGPFLPGGGCELTLHPRSKVRHEDIRLVHAVVSTLLDEGHGQQASFSLVPWPRGCGWAIYSPSSRLQELARGRHECRFEGTPALAEFGLYARVKAPQVVKRGHQRVRVSAVTPVVITSCGRQNERQFADEDSLRSSLERSLAPRLGASASDLCIELVDACTEPVAVDCGGKFGLVRGWLGSIVVEVNAVGRWLLEAAARGPGLGRRTALGFGRVRVEVA